MSPLDWPKEIWMGVAVGADLMFILGLIVGAITIKRIIWRWDSPIKEVDRLYTEAVKDMRRL